MSVFDEDIRKLLEKAKPGLLGGSSKAQYELGWKYEMGRVGFKSVSQET